MMTPFVEQLLAACTKGARVLDVGAGDGRLAKILADHGARVTAIDLHQEKEHDENITWLTGDARTISWEQQGPYDIIVMKNLLQFVPKEDGERLLEKARSTLSNGGVLAVEAFTRPPEPPFSKPNTSYWGLTDISNPALMPIIEEEVTEEGKDMNGTVRTFFLTRYIAKKT